MRQAFPIRALALVVTLLWLAAGGQAAEGLFGRAARYHFGESRRDLTRIEEQVRAAADRAETAAPLERRLLTLLEDTAATTEARAFAGRQLRLLGSKAAVPALMRLLDDPRLSAPARAALEVLPDPLATKALTNALPRLTGDRRLGVLNSLGERRDPLAVTALLNAVTNGPPATVNAAAAALGKIGDARALAALWALAGTFDSTLATNAPAWKPPPALAAALDRQVVTEALLQNADQRLRAGDAPGARTIYRAVYVSAAVPPYGRVAALRGLVEVDPAGALPVVLGLVDSGDHALQGVGLSLLRDLTAVGLLQLLSRLPQLEPPAQAKLIGVLAERGEATLAPTFISLTQAENAPLRRAAIRALGRIPTGAEAVQRLAELAATGDPLTADAARETLPRLYGPGVEDALLEGVALALPPLRIELIRATVPRRSAAALPAIFEAATNGNEALRRAALEALGALAEPEQFPLLVEFLRAAETPEERQTALRAVQRVGRRLEQREEASRSLAAAYPQADPALKAALLTACPVVGGAAALQLVAQAAAKESRRALREQALAALAQWPDDAARQPLFALATTLRDPADRTVALRGLVRLLGLPSQRPATETARLLQLALPVARTSGERRVILAGLSRLPHPASLAAITPFLADPTVRTEAALAVVRVAQYLGGIAPAAAAAALEQVEQRVQADNLLKTAQAARTRIETWAGNVEVWRLAGPWATSAQTGEGAEPALPKLADAAWRLVPAAAGRLKITPLASRALQVAVLRTELLVPEAAQAVFRLQHRGRTTLQLDGQPLPQAGRENAGPRPAQGQITEEFPTPLSAGRHAVQIVTFRPSDGAEWQLSLQITTPDGAPLPALLTRPEP